MFVCKKTFICTLLILLKVFDDCCCLRVINYFIIALQFEIPELLKHICVFPYLYLILHEKNEHSD